LERGFLYVQAGESPLKRQDRVVAVFDCDDLVLICVSDTPSFSEPHETTINHELNIATLCAGQGKVDGFGRVMRAS
jgi:hypothetical protein